MITPENIIRHELVGLHTRIIQSANSQMVGTSGDIVDETKHMFVLQTDSGTKSIPKDINTWGFCISGIDIHINGANITKRSAERLMIK